MNGHSFSIQKAFLMVILCLVALLRSCHVERMREYYSQKANYVESTGIVTHMVYNEDGSSLVLIFSDLSAKFSDNSFKIVGENLSLVEERGIAHKVEIGDEVSFISAPKYFGDGYVMPIVALEVDGETLLEFEEGFENLMERLN